MRPSPAPSPKQAQGGHQSWSIMVSHIVTTLHSLQSTFPLGLHHTVTSALGGLGWPHEDKKCEGQGGWASTRGSLAGQWCGGCRISIWGFLGGQAGGWGGMGAVGRARGDLGGPGVEHATPDCQIPCGSLSPWEQGSWGLASTRLKPQIFVGDFCRPCR